MDYPHFIEGETEAPRNLLESLPLTLEGLEPSGRWSRGVVREESCMGAEVLGTESKPGLGWSCRPG